MTQSQRILRHMQDHGSITSAEAFLEYGVARCASRIHDLRKQGWQIDSKPVKSTNRYGESVTYSRYEWA